MITAPPRRSAKRPASRPASASAFPFVIREERRLRDWTQRQMAGHLGVSQSTIARWELGTRRPGVAELERIGHLLNVVFHVI